ncbi:Disease resistance protein L6 [Linum perenne]
MASNSLSADTMVPLPTGEYEVFLSFRGPDVRHTFADCLYNCLVRSKIRTFRDEEELQKGETIAPSLVKAITESKIYIPIFTRSYASSKWCLQELAEMVKCWKTGKGHLILPIFYLMDPRDVRHQEAGPYKEAFQQHCLKHDQQTVMAWREALQEVGKMKGWHVTESNGLGAVIDQVLTKVELHLRANYTLVTDELVGIDFHIEEVIKLLNFDFASDKIVGIHGMGGLGKTTLAKAVYNEVSAQFDRCCFLEDVREILSKDGGAVTLQNIIISNILRTESDKARNGNDGNQVIKDRVSKHKLLIVLDDVDERFQFDDILGKLSNFSVDSRFLITTRDARVLELLQQCRLYELGAMSHDYALKLFSKHAFGEGYPPEDYSTLSEEFVQVAAGLPLALKVIGSLLFHTNKRFWEAKLIELKEIPPTKVQERLKISYNELTYNEKQIFLDVACLFIGADTEMPFCMWSDCDFYPESTLRTLAQRCFLRMSENKEFWMHDHVRDLGRAIVREENNQNPCKRSRVWSNRDALNMLKHGQVARKLKVVSLLNCYNLSKVPDLSICESLELLDFSGCGWMRGELDIGNFKKLRLLMVRGTRITKLRGIHSFLGDAICWQHHCISGHPPASRLSSLQIFQNPLQYCILLALFQCLNVRKNSAVFGIEGTAINVLAPDDYMSISKQSFRNCDWTCLMEVKTQKRIHHCDQIHIPLRICEAALFVPKFAHFETRKSSQRGGTLGPSLVKAITESKIYIPIFTEKYASSKWCLQELAKMVECWKTGKGHLILPIFYLMDPRDVRHQEAGAYKEAFEQHSLKQDPVTVKEWRGALQVVGEMKGWHVTKSDGQGAIIDHVFTKVELHLRANYTLMTDELVGIDFRVEEVMRLLNLDSTSEKFVGIHGSRQVESCESIAELRLQRSSRLDQLQRSGVVRFLSLSRDAWRTGHWKLQESKTAWG